jgi:uncharacterized protein
MSPREEIEIADAPDRDRYEIRVDGKLAGFAKYDRKPGQITFTHTEIEDRFEGRGLGSQLIRYALREARESEVAVLPVCPFVKDFIQRHREYAELVPEARRGEFGL